MRQWLFFLVASAAAGPVIANDISLADLPAQLRDCSGRGCRLSLAGGHLWLQVQANYDLTQDLGSCSVRCDGAFCRSRAAQAPNRNHGRAALHPRGSRAELR